MSLTRLNKTITIMNWVAIFATISCLALIFFYVPTERTMGNVQRIFYFHVGAGWTASAAFFVALMGGVLYLIRPNRQWDILALASIELGLVFTTMNITSGSIWGKPAWNTWWIWSPRLVSITVLWLVYAAYFMLRGAIEDPDRKARFSAVYSIAAFVTVIITYYSIRLFRDIHPALAGASDAAQGEQDLTSPMVFTMLYSFITFSILYASWLLNRIRLEFLNDEVRGLKRKVLLRLQG
jgi:heme exporter protein C